jgi:hypothetical protein
MYQLVETTFVFESESPVGVHCAGGNFWAPLSDMVSSDALRGGWMGGGVERMVGGAGCRPLTLFAAADKPCSVLPFAFTA